MIFDIAAVGIDKSEIKIEADSNMLKVSHEKDSSNDGIDYIHKGIARRAFNLGWKVSPKYDLKSGLENTVKFLKEK